MSTCSVKGSVWPQGQIVLLESQFLLFAAKWPWVNYPLFLEPISSSGKSGDMGLGSRGISEFMDAPHGAWFWKMLIKHLLSPSDFFPNPNALALEV